MSKQANPEDVFTCGVKGCGHVVKLRDAGDIRLYQRDKDIMIDHYKWEHTRLVCTLRKGTPGVAFNEWNEYNGIPDAIGPILTYEGEDTTWAEICEIEGRA